MIKAIKDYFYKKRYAKISEYIRLNIGCPNAEGLDNWRSAMSTILDAIDNKQI